MEPITLYFAGAFKGKADQQEFDVGIRNKLCSYLYPDQFKSWIEITQSSPGKILIDSGAFSAWNKGDVIDFDNYIIYCKEAIKIAEQRRKQIRVVNLDVIPGKKGQTGGLNRSVKSEDKAIIEEAAAAGYKNLCYFLKRGVTPIHVFHQGEDFKWLEKMVEKTDYIGVSPANDVGVNQKRLWIDRVFNYLDKKKISVKTHGFAVFSPGIVLNYPWTSCDAATWRLVAAYGGIYYPVGGYSNPDFSKQPLIIRVSKESSTGLVRFSTQITELLKCDGYSFELLQESWEERAKANIQYFLELEKWVNNEKKGRQFAATCSKGFALF